jgi:acetyl-CoA acyltransferase 2
MENMSQAPHVIRGARKGFKLGQGSIEDSLMVALLDSYSGLYMAQTSDNLARKYDISRDEQDQFALRSQTCAAAASKSGKFDEEIVGVPVGRKGEIITTDDHLRPETTIEGLGKLKPAFAKDGFVTAGNASGIVDGAAAVVLTTADRAKAEKLDVWCTIRSWAYVGVDPTEMGIGPVPAIRKCLERAGLSVQQVDRIEINEAFAAQYLGCEKELELDRAKCNVNGGAISLGHPLGATGTRLVLTLMHELRRSGKRYGVASACIGGGQGIAILIENTTAGTKR